MTPSTPDLRDEFAFPGVAYFAEGVEQHNPGMTLRDWFAGQALPAIINADGIQYASLPESQDQHALAAYGHAEAMIRASHVRTGAPCPVPGGVQLCGPHMAPDGTGGWVLKDGPYMTMPLPHPAPAPAPVAPVDDALASALAERDAAVERVRELEDVTELSRLRAEVEGIRWIPCEERLPEDGQNVAFVTKCERDEFYHKRVLGGRFTAGEFGGFSVPGFMSDASHWMPLPPTPLTPGAKP